MQMKRIVHFPRKTIILGALVLGSAALLQMFDINPAASQTLALTAYESNQDPGLDPASAAWRQALPVRVPLTAQTVAYAAGGGSIPTISARALHYQDRLYIRVEWSDATRDQSTTRVQDFSDAVAVEFPAVSASSVPSICMGQADSGVNIWQWRADSQAGLKDPTATYTQALVDSYPSKDDLWYPARASDNPYANPEAGPVQTLVAHAFGTLSPANTQDVKGNGVYENGTWAVVFERQLTGADADQATFATSGKTDVAFAAWNGSQGDRNGRKAVSQFVTLSLAGPSSVAVKGHESWTFIIAIGLLVGMTAIGIGLAAIGVRTREGTS
jgi:complex iron-sulfur molybdoenzyme family reductase subunit gamma